MYLYYKTRARTHFHTKQNEFFEPQMLDRYPRTDYNEFTISQDIFGLFCFPRGMEIVPGRKIKSKYKYANHSNKKSLQQLTRFGKDITHSNKLSKDAATNTTDNNRKNRKSLDLARGRRDTQTKKSEEEKKEKKELKKSKSKNKSKTTTTTTLKKSNDKKKDQNTGIGNIEENIEPKASDKLKLFKTQLTDKIGTTLKKMPNISNMPPMPGTNKKAASGTNATNFGKITQKSRSPTETDASEQRSRFILNAQSPTALSHKTPRINSNKSLGSFSTVTSVKDATNLNILGPEDDDDDEFDATQTPNALITPAAFGSHVSGDISRFSMKTSDEDPNIDDIMDLDAARVWGKHGSVSTNVSSDNNNGVDNIRNSRMSGSDDNRAEGQEMDAIAKRLDLQSGISASASSVENSQDRGCVSVVSEDSVMSDRPAAIFSAQKHTFVLSTDKGDRIYGACVVFYEENERSPS